jgi:acid phosphatase
MRTRAFLFAAVLAFGGSLVSSGDGGGQPAERKSNTSTWREDLPRYDHVVIVVEENKDYDQIIDNVNAPYINFTLREEGANFTQMYGEEHNSQGNYFWLFSGSNQNVGFQDVVPGTDAEPRPFNTPNLGAALIAARKSFKGYAEDLPAIGSTVKYIKNKAGDTIYGRKHVPWISIGNVPHGDTVETSSDLRFCDFPKGRAEFDTLPTVAFVVPNLEHDMHNGKPAQSIPRGDAWLQKNIDPYYQWAKEHNSLLIVTWDESDNKTNYRGLTNPLVLPRNQFRRDLQNRIPTIFAGAHINPRNYPEGDGITHVSILRTLEAMYGLPRSGAQQPNAAGAGISDDYVITDVFATAKE